MAKATDKEESKEDFRARLKAILAANGGPREEFLHTMHLVEVLESEHQWAMDFLRRLRKADPALFKYHYVPVPDPENYWKE